MGSVIEYLHSYFCQVQNTFCQIQIHGPIYCIFFQDMSLKVFFLIICFFMRGIELLSRIFLTKPSEW